MNDFKSLFRESRQGDEHWVARAIHEFTDDLHQLMDRRGVTRADLARQLDSSPAYVTKVLRGDANFTVRSMVRLARALDGRLVLGLEPEEEPVRWIDLVGQTRQGLPHHSGDPFEAKPQLRLVWDKNVQQPSTEATHDPVAA